jgi:sterol desaturase/sphingolipid hydroxylase (fatty acid hydroxylase superfamily)
MIDVMAIEPALRLASFVGMLVVMSAAEARWPRLPRTQKRLVRWRTNLSLSVLGTGLARLASLAPAPIAGAAMAAWAQAQGFGLFNVLAWPFWLEVALAIVVLDFAIWAQHVATHKIPFLWRLHGIHHADRDIDATTALRFHPVEIGLSMLLKAALVAVIGAPIVAVILFEVLLNGCAIFNHANVTLPPAVEKRLRWLIVTPSMHLVHHSVRREEHDSNYGFCLAIWDRIFRTWREAPIDGVQGMTIGIAGRQDGAPARLSWALWAPVKGL